jgi:hypothetical protein
VRRTVPFVALALVIVAAVPARAGAPAYQPDLVSGASGDGIYGRDPVQTGELGLSPYFGIAIEFGVQNDGAQIDTMRLRLRSSGDPGFAARVTMGTDDVTSEFSPGPYRVRHLAPDGAFTFGMGFLTTDTVTPGDTATFRLVAISAGDRTRRDVWVVTVTALEPGT